MTHFHKNRLFSPILLFVFVVLVPITVHALTPDDITFPIAELGGCASEAQCKLYCDAPENIPQCLDFAEEYQLLPQDEIDHARKFEDFHGNDFKGPGGCDSTQSCERYCSDVRNINECLLFAEEYNLLEEDQLEEAKQIQQALDSGLALPGGCTDEQSCTTYCESGNNMRECLLFAEKAGFLEEDELEEAKRFLTLLDEGKTPEEVEDFEPPFNAVDYALNVDVVLNDLPEEVRKCVIDAFGFDRLENIKDEQDVETFEHFIGKCFEEIHEREFEKMHEEEKRLEEAFYKEKEEEYYVEEEFDEHGFPKDEKPPEDFYFDDIKPDEVFMHEEAYKQKKEEEKKSEDEKVGLQQFLELIAASVYRGVNSIIF